MFERLQIVYGGLNNGLFHGALPPVEFEYQPDHHVTFAFLRPYVIGIGRNFNITNRLDVLDHMLHQMVHIYNVQCHGVKEWRSPDYHQRYFMGVALAHGLNIIKHARNGWSISTSRPVCPCHNPHPQCDGTGKRCDCCPVRVSDQEHIRQRQRVYANIAFTPDDLLEIQEQNMQLQPL
jgi:hypothetical protein